MISHVVEQLVECSNSELDERLRALELERRHIDSEMAAVVAVARVRGVNADDGHPSMKGYLRATLNASNADVERLSRTSRLIDAVPSVGDAWRAGHIGSSQANELARAFAHPRAGNRLAEFVPVLLEHAEHLRFVAFKVCVDTFVRLADVDGAHRDADLVAADRRARVAATSDGGIDIAVTGGNPESAEMIVNVFQQFAEREFDRDARDRCAEHGQLAEAHPLFRTVQQRAHDAIEAIFRAAASTSADSRAPEPVVNIVVDASTFDDALRAHGLEEDPSLHLAELGRQILNGAADLIGRRCETAGGVAIAPDAMLRAALTGHVRRVVVDAAGNVVDLGRAQRLFTGSSRTAAQLLVRSCSHPGCQIPATLCDVDHVQEWGTGGGRTDQVNSAVLCGSHNRHKHRKQWSLKRATNKRLSAIRGDGTVVLPVGEREPEWFDAEDDPVEIARIERHIRGRLDSLVPS